jgi:hypothetical protein
MRRPWPIRAVVPMEKMDFGLSVTEISGYVFQMVSEHFLFSTALTGLLGSKGILCNVNKELFHRVNVVVA